MQQEYELIEHGITQNLKIFLVGLDYRTPHFHKQLEICFLLDGTVTVISGKNSVLFHKDDFFVLNPYQPHELRAASHALILSVQIPASFCKDYYPAIDRTEFAFGSGVDLIGLEKTQYIRNLTFDMARQYFSMEDAFELICTARANELLYQLVKLFPHTIFNDKEMAKNRDRYRRVRRLIEYIDSHYTQKLLLTDLAQQEGLSLSYLSHFFKDCFQMSFQNYLQSIRCEKARHQLLTTGLNLLEISMDCGFSDVKYLNATFLKQYGLSPKEYRKKHTPLAQQDRWIYVLSVQEFLPPDLSLEILKQLG